MEWNGMDCCVPPAQLTVFAIFGWFSHSVAIVLFSQGNFLQLNAFERIETNDSIFHWTLPWDLYPQISTFFHFTFDHVVLWAIFWLKSHHLAGRKMRLKNRNCWFESDSVHLLLMSKKARATPIAKENLRMKIQSLGHIKSCYSWLHDWKQEMKWNRMK